MNKNILYAFISIFLIVGIALTVPKGAKNNQQKTMTIDSNQRNSVMDIADENKEINLEIENNERKSIIVSKPAESNKESSQYTENELNRAKMYKQKSWAKDDTINDAAWKDAKISEFPTTQTVSKPENPTKNKSESTSTLNTANIQDNSTMIE